jgi:hypothetical protein
VSLLKRPLEPSLLAHPASKETWVEANLSTLFLDAGLTQDDADGVSLKQLVIFALQSHSPHWADLAVGWLQQGFAMDNEIVQVIDTLSSNKVIHQNTRHKAFSLARQWQRKAN